MPILCAACGAPVYKEASADAVPHGQNQEAPGASGIEDISKPPQPASSMGEVVRSLRQTSQPSPSSSTVCPKCGLYSPGTPSRCNCGYDFLKRVTPSTPPNTRVDFAGFWLRAAALVIDYVILILFFATLSVVQIALGGSPEDSEDVWTVMSLLVNWLYYALMESSARQATLGKSALGLTVTDLRGERVSFGKATGRFFAKILSGMILGIGYLMAGFTKSKQALHDSVAGCLVWRARSLRESQETE